MVAGPVSIMIAISSVVVFSLIRVVPILVAVVLARVMFSFGTLVFVGHALIFDVTGIAAVFFTVSFVE